VVAVVYALADGSEVTLNVTVAEIEFMAERVGVTVIYGPDDGELILGVTALKSVGIEVDPRSQRLKRLPAVRLKKGRRRRAKSRRVFFPGFSAISADSALNVGFFSKQVGKCQALPLRTTL
jgi:hypothetical protein